MSVLAALLDSLSVPELTVPVQLGDGSTRGLFDQNGSSIDLGDVSVQLTGPILFVAKGTLSALAAGVNVTVGALGAASAAGGKQYHVHGVDPIQDGLVLACRIGGGR